MTEVLLIACITLLLTCLALLIILLRRRDGGVIRDDEPILRRLESIESEARATPTAMRDELTRGRAEASETARQLRGEVAAQLAGTNTAIQEGGRLLREDVTKAIGTFVDSALGQIRDSAAGQRERLEAFSARIAALTSDVNSRLKEGHERSEKQIADMQQLVAENSRRAREETNAAVGEFRKSVIEQLGLSAAGQKAQLDAFGVRLGEVATATDQRLTAAREMLEARLTTIQEASAKQLGEVREEGKSAAQATRTEITSALKAFQESLKQQLEENTVAVRRNLSEVVENLGKIAGSNEKRMEELRLLVDQRLKEIQEDSTKKLDQVRLTVDEKLQGTLEKRLGESFKLVSDRLEQVHKGLGEMQTLASGVGDLKKVLSNVKARGTWGEAQLGNILEQVLTKEQYEQNVATKPGSAERVEFAIKLPGAAEDPANPLWLPIDAKCPLEDYDRLVKASEQGDADGVREATKQLEARIRACGKMIAEKYLSPPSTTDFGILFVPTEGLYAEILRCPGLADSIQRESRVMVAGPTTLWAILSSLQMGFRTLAIEKRSSEVWKVLSAVKTEFGKFGDVFKKVKKKLDEASNTLEDASVRTRAMERRLRTVDELPVDKASELLGLAAPPTDLDSDSAPASSPLS